MRILCANGCGIQRLLTQDAEVTIMKAKVEMVANVVVILLAVAMGSVFLKDRFAIPGPEPNEVKAGDRLVSLEGGTGAHTIGRCC
jgi:hypothetical protein